MSADDRSERPTSVLVIGAAPEHRKLLRGHLEPAYRVIEHDDGTHGLEHVRAGEVSLVLLDLAAPSERDLELCRTLKAHSTDGFLPVLVVAAIHDRDVRRAGLEAGADDVLARPVDGPELRVRMQTFLRMRDAERSIRAQLEELKKLDALKDDLVALMAHDLRNPVAGLSVLLHALHRDATDPQQRRDLATAIRATERVRDTIDDMLAVRRLEEAVVPLQRAVVGLRGVVSDAVTTLLDVAVGRRIDIEEELDERATAHADAKLVRRAVENLVANAIRYSREGSVVSIALRVQDGQVHIEVGDRGPGLTPEARAALVSKPSAPGQSGHGLGLHLVNLVARAHGGRVEVEDRDGGGALFRLVLPAEAP